MNTRAKTDISKSKDVPEPCPTCGHCPTCGRDKQDAQPVYIPYPVTTPQPAPYVPWNPMPWYGGVWMNGAAGGAAGNIYTHVIDTTAVAQGSAHYQNVNATYMA